MGINYDWNFGDGMIVVNKRGLSKTAMGLNPGPLARWTSKYGSVTFCQYGRELVQSGMNEAGLFVAGLSLLESEWPDPDSRPSVRSAQWVQYQLDNSASVGEVIQSDKEIRISSTGSSAVHFYVCDKTEACAVIEFLNGKLIQHSGAKLPIKVVTDSSYSQCLQYLDTGKAPRPDRTSAVRRFLETANNVKGINSKAAESIDTIFNILKKVEHGTQWSIIYDLSQLQVHFRSASNERISHFSLSEFDFSCTVPVKVLHVQNASLGAVGTKFSDYTTAANKDLIQNAFKKSTSLSNLPRYVADEYSLYPESFTCTLKQSDSQ